MFVFSPVKFDNCVVNVAGIHYQLHSIGIEAILLKPWVELLHKLPKYQKWNYSTYILKISSNYKKLIFFVNRFFGVPCLA